MFQLTKVETEEWQRLKPEVPTVCFDRAWNSNALKRATVAARS